MLTIDKLRVYQRYNGNPDDLCRAKNAADIAAMSDDEWHKVDELLLRLSIEKTGLAAESFVTTTNLLLAEWVNDDATVNLLRNLAKGT